jgi:hypothetical protein
MIVSILAIIILIMVETGASDQTGSLSSQLKIEKYEKVFAELEASIDKLGASATEA